MSDQSIILDPAQRSRDLRNEVRRRLAARESARSSGANRRLTARIHGWGRHTAAFWLDRRSS